MGCFECQAAEVTVLDADAHLLGELIDEAARTGGAGLVHLVVDHNAVPLNNELRVLSADFDDICLGIEVHGGSGLGRDLVLDQVGPNEAAHQVSSRAGDADTSDLCLVTHVLEKVAEDFLDGVDGPAGSHQIALGHHFGAGLVEYDRLGAGGADIHAEVANERMLDWGMGPAVVLPSRLLQPRHLEVVQRRLDIGQFGDGRGLPGSLGQKCCAHGFDVEVVVGNDDVHLVAVSGRDDFVEGLDDGGVAGHAADAVDGLLEGALLQGGHHAGDAAAQRVEHGPYRDALLLQVYEVGLGEDAAPGSYSRRLSFELQRQAGEVLHGDAQAIRLLLKEHACAGGAQRIGGHAPRFAESVDEFDDKRALAADLDDRLGIRVKVQDA